MGEGARGEPLFSVFSVSTSVHSVKLSRLYLLLYGPQKKNAPKTISYAGYERVYYNVTFSTVFRSDRTIT